MRVETASIVVPTDGKGTYEITDRIAAAVRRSGVTTGVVTVFVRHTSCSLILMENADPTARRDLETGHGTDIGAAGEPRLWDSQTPKNCLDMIPLFRINSRL